MDRHAGRRRPGAGVVLEVVLAHTDLDETTQQHDAWLQKVGQKKTSGDVAPQGEKAKKKGKAMASSSVAPM